MASSPATHLGVGGANTPSAIAICRTASSAQADFEQLKVSVRTSSSSTAWVVNESVIKTLRLVV